MSYTRLTHAEREEIALGIAAGHTSTEIGALLGRRGSTISREIRRHGGGDAYRPLAVRQAAACRTASQAHRRSRRLDAHPALLSWGQSRLRRPKTRALDGRGQLPDRVSIHERPAEVEGRQVPGHWEADLVMGAGNRSAIATLVERTSRLVLLVKLEAKDAASVAQALTRRLKQLPASLRKTLTYDQGKEMARHADLTLATGIAGYFCDPHSPWQRGSNENTNGLIRDFFPKSTDFTTVSAQKLNWVQQALNERPRQTLDWKTPKQIFNQLLAASIDALAT